MSNETTSEPEDVRHAAKAVELMSRDPVCARMNDALMLLQEGIMLIPKCEWPDVFPNTFGALACIARAYRQLRGAFMLAVWGYCAEARAILRSAYESAALARTLAKDSAFAEKWVRKQHWFPDREVRAWFAASGPNDAASADEVLKDYAKAYKHGSTMSHPTAISCISALNIDEDGVSARLETVFSEDDFLACAAEIAATTLFACFTLRNAAISEKAIDPQWRKRLYELARKITNTDMPHLERDWAEEQRSYEELRRKVRSANDLAEHLRKHLASWDNLRSQPDEAQPTASTQDDQSISSPT